MPFTAETFDKDSRHIATNYGWAIVVLTLLCVVVNQVAMAIAVYKKIK